MKKYYYGAVEITKALGLPPADHMKVGYFLRLIEAPQVLNEKRVKTNCLTKKQIDFLKRELLLIKTNL